MIGLKPKEGLQLILLNWGGDVGVFLWVGCVCVCVCEGVVYKRVYGWVVGMC